MSAQKTAVLVEMLVLLGGGLVIKHKAAPTWLAAAQADTRTAIAVVILLAALLTLVDLGAGAFAVAFGALVSLGYLAAAGGALGSEVLAVERGLLG